MQKIVKIIASKPRNGQDSIVRLIGREYQGRVDSHTGQCMVREPAFGGEIILGKDEYEVIEPQRTRVRVNFNNGDYLYTHINGTEQSIRNYYVGNEFNLGTGGNDLMVTAVEVIFIDGKP